MNSEQINQIMNHYNMNSGDFAEAIGTAPATISNIRNGKTKATLEIVEKIRIRFPEINLEWLIDGKGEMIKVTDFEKDNKQKVVSQLSLDDLFEEQEGFLPEKKKQDDTSCAKVTTKSVREASDKTNSTPDTRSVPSVEDVRPKDSVVLENIKREIVKIIVYYNDKTFDEIDVAKCRV